MVDWRAIIGKCNQSVDESSLSLLLFCLFKFQFGEALKKMVPARKKTNDGKSCTGPPNISLLVRVDIGSLILEP